MKPAPGFSILVSKRVILILIGIIVLVPIAASKRALLRRNSRQLRRLSRLYDWEVSESGDFKPVITSEKVQRSIDSKRQNHCANDSYILTELFKDYNRHKIPNGKVNVIVEVWVQEITTISDITSDFQLDIYISESWYDPGMAFAYMEPCKQNMSLNSVLLEKLWGPANCFINSKTASIHNSPFPNIFFMIYANGTVWINYRLKLTGPCVLALETFPFDNVTCSLTFESFNYGITEVSMAWSDLGVSKMKDKIELADYELEGISNYRKEELYPAGLWHELTMEFKFRRRAGWYILQAYLPSYITICISWISFALGKNIPARTMLGVNSLLSMTFLFGNIIKSLPRVSYIKGIDVWMLSGMTMVFASLIELACVGYLCREETNAPDEVEKQPLSIMNSSGSNNELINLSGDYTNDNGYKSNGIIKNAQQMLPQYLQFDAIGGSLHRRAFSGTNEEERTLLNTKENDYGYIPPGYGLQHPPHNLSLPLCSCKRKGGNALSRSPGFYGGIDQEDRHSPSCTIYQDIYGNTSPRGPSSPQQFFNSGENTTIFKTQQRTDHISSVNTEHDRKTKALWRKYNKERLAQQIDKWSALLFPFTFGIFNLAYWYYYLG